MEWVFSKMGDIKTKKRNRLGMKKLRDITYIKSELRRCHANDGITSKRLKRQFGNPKPTTNTNVAAVSGARYRV
jgi:hypothetical protein